MATTPSVGSRCEQGGFVLPLFAASLTVLLGFAGIGVDVWNWYYTAQHAQRAADAGALAGAVFMPDNFSTANSTARGVVASNGFTTAGDVTVAAGDRPSRLRVAVEATVENNFLRFLGNETTTVERSAVGEYAGRVPMGSPENTLGNDPTLGRRVDHWVSDSGRGSTKQGGDRYQSAVCTGEPAYNCPAGNAEPQSAEYDPNGYTFVVRVNEASTSGALNFEIFDPALIPMAAQDCGESGGSTEPLPLTGTANNDLASIQDDWSDSSRYDDARAPGGDVWCVGDSPGSTYNTTGLCRVAHASCNGGQAFAPNNNPNLVQTFIVRAPDNTLTSDLDNPVIGGCTQQYAPWTVHSGRNYYSLLNNDDGYRDGEAARFHAEFRQWVSICSVSASTVNDYLALGQRDFIVQALTNAPHGTPTGRNAIKGGRNHFAIRAYLGSSPASPGDIDVFANGRLPMHAAAQGASTVFYVAKVGPGNAGRTLSIEFYDVGDATAPGTLIIQRPAGAGGGAWSCSFRRSQNNGTVDTPPGSGCQLNSVNSSNGYQGALTVASVGIPANYTCDPNTPTGCWVTIRFAYSGTDSVFDHTVWSAGLVGDPVRLIE